MTSRTLDDDRLCDACDAIWEGTNGDALCDVSGCPGCHYVLGAAALGGMIAWGQAVQETYGEILLPCEDCGAPTTADRAYCDACEWGDVNTNSQMPSQRDDGGK